MIYKISLVTLLSVLNLFGVDLLYPNGKIETFSLLKKSKSTKKTQTIYIKNNRKYIDTRTIYISFGKKTDIENFVKKYDLIFIKFTNSSLYTAMFAVKYNKEILKLCSLINQNEDIRYAKPNWKRKRLLK